MLESLRRLLYAIIRMLDIILYFSLGFLLCIVYCSLTKTSWILEVYLIDQIVHVIGRKELSCVIGVAIVKQSYSSK